MSEKIAAPSITAAFHPFYPPIFRAFAPVVAATTRVFAPNYRVTGRQNIPHSGAAIFVSNHISDADPLMIGLALRRPLHWMAKRELWTWASIAPFLAFLGAFPVDPSSPDRSALKTAEAVIGADEGLGVFPEGEISQTGELQRLLPGAVMLALKSGAPIVPLGIEGTQHIVPFSKLIPRPTLRPVRIHFGPVLRLDDLAELPARAARSEATQRLEVALRSAVQHAKR